MACFGRNKVNLSDSQKPDIDIKTLTTEVIPDHIFQNFLNIASKIGNA